jgi:hypothetical protein
MNVFVNNWESVVKALYQYDICSYCKYGCQNDENVGIIAVREVEHRSVA